MMREVDKRGIVEPSTYCGRPDDQELPINKLISRSERGLCGASLGAARKRGEEREKRTGETCGIETPSCREMYALTLPCKG